MCSFIFFVFFSFFAEKFIEFNADCVLENNEFRKKRKKKLNQLPLITKIKASQCGKCISKGKKEHLSKKKKF